APSPALFPYTTLFRSEPIFGEGGGRGMAEQYGVPWLGSLPLAMSIREQTDSGLPTVLAAPDSAEAQLYHDIATRLAARVSLLPRSEEHTSELQSRFAL